MTDSPDARPSLSQISQPASDWTACSTRSVPDKTPPDKTPVQVTLTLPPELVTALQQANPQLPSQPLSQQILTLLQQAIAHQQSQPPAPEQQPEQQIKQQTTEQSLSHDLEQLKQRLSHLEAFLPRIASVEGKVDRLLRGAAIPDQNIPASLSRSESFEAEAPIADEPLSEPIQAAAIEVIDSDGNPGSAVASIWMQIQQSGRPPASIPSTLQPSEPCPKCQQRLMPFKSLGGVRCIGCGWTDKPRNQTAAPGVTNLDLQRLLEQAAVDSEENMKPRKRSR